MNYHKTSLGAKKGGGSRIGGRKTVGEKKTVGGRLTNKPGKKHWTSLIQLRRTLLNAGMGGEEKQRSRIKTKLLQGEESR